MVRRLWPRPRPESSGSVPWRSSAFQTNRSSGMARWPSSGSNSRFASSSRDIATLVPGSRSADVTAELIYVGRGDRESDYAGKTVGGRIVLVSGPVAPAHNLAVRKFGAAGVVSFSTEPGSRRPARPGGVKQSGTATSGRRTRCANDVRPDALLARGSGTHPAARRELESDRAREGQGDGVPADMQVVVATIAGDGSTREPEKTELVFVAHLFEHRQERMARRQQHLSAVPRGGGGLHQPAGGHPWEHRLWT